MWPSTGLSGSLGSWHDRGFTFIKSTAGDFFCHITGLHKSLFNEEGALLDAKSVDENTLVTFDVIADPRDTSRLRATNVRLSPPAKEPAPVQVPPTQPEKVNEDAAEPATPAQSRRNSAAGSPDSKHAEGTRSSSPPLNGNLQGASGGNSTPPARSRSTSPRISSLQTTSLPRGRSRSPMRSSRSASRGAALQKAASRAHQ